MGDFKVKFAASKSELVQFTKNLLNDIQAFETLLSNDTFEKGITMIGAEQEMCLVDKNYKPYSKNLSIIEKAKMDNLSPELAQFNLETNTIPYLFRDKALSQMENEISDDLAKIRNVAKEFEADTILTGILPTVRKFDVERERITPYERYFALIDTMREIRGEEFLINISGIDDLNIKLSNGLIEAANTGFQIHLQVSPDEFRHKYNIAQAIAGVALAPAVNSPLLFGKRLWKETRIALFQQAIDTRISNEHIRDRHPRVTFGTSWINESVIELFKEDIMRYRVLLGAEFDEDSLEIVRKGGVPQLKALTVHNSTVYRWNRPVYGISPNGKPHLRIEARMFPAGPTVVDEMANAAFWLGLLEGYSQQLDDVTKYLNFDEAKANFYVAAVSGMSRQITWFNHKKYTIKDLILNELLPIARTGLERNNIATEDIDKYLGIIEERVAKEITGSNWMLAVYDNLQNKASKEEILTMITMDAIENQKAGIPVHEWDIPDIKELPHWHPSKLLVEEVMRTDVLSVQPDDIVEFVSDMMIWENMKYVPVEDREGNFVGLVTSTRLLKVLRKLTTEQNLKELKVKDIMIENPETIEPSQKIQDAMIIMDKAQIGSLPVVYNDKLIGMLTETEFFYLSRRLFERF